MAIGVGTGEVTAQFLRQSQQLSQRSIQAQQDNQDQAANSFIKRVGAATVKNQQIAVDAFQQQAKRSSAVDISV